MIKKYTITSKDIIGSGIDQTIPDAYLSEDDLAHIRQIASNGSYWASPVINLPDHTYIKDLNNLGEN